MGSCRKVTSILVSPMEVIAPLKPRYLYWSRDVAAFAMSLPNWRCLRLSAGVARREVSTEPAIRADPFLVLAKPVLEGCENGAFLGVTIDERCAAEAQKNKDGTVGAEVVMSAVCAEVDVDVQQILGVSVVPRNVCCRGITCGH